MWHFAFAADRQRIRLRRGIARREAVLQRIIQFGVLAFGRVLLLPFFLLFHDRYLRVRFGNGCVALTVANTVKVPSKATERARNKAVIARCPRHESAAIRSTIAILKQSFQLFSANPAASRGAAIAFYGVTSIAPVLLIVIAIAGGFVTALLFESGKFLIGIYLGSSTADGSLGASGALLGIFVRVYYSAQIFLLGAAFTCSCAEHRAVERAGSD